MANHQLRFIGDVLKEYRKRTGMTQQDLAGFLNVTYNYISLLENGNAHPSIETLVKVSLIIGVDPGEILSNIVKRELANKKSFLHQFVIDK